MDIFGSTYTSINTWAQQLVMADIEKCFGSAIMMRSKSYQNAFRKIIKEGNVIKAKVDGTQTYKLKIWLNGDKINGECSCPYGSGCKHLAALVVHISQNKASFADTVESEDIFDFRGYIQTKSKEELIELVIRFAPEAYRRTIENMHSKTSEQKNIINNIQTDVLNCINNIDYQDDAYTVASELSEYFHDLIGMGVDVAEDVLKLTIKMCEKIEKVIDNGYLYDEYNDSGFDGLEIAEAVVKYYIHLPHDVQINHFTKILETEDGRNYDLNFNWFYHIASFCDLDVLIKLTKNLVIKTRQISNTDTGNIVKRLMSEPKTKDTIDFAEYFLQHHKDNYFTDYLLDYYENNNDPKKSISLLVSHVMSNINTSHNIPPDRKYFEKLIHLVSVHTPEDMDMFCLKYFGLYIDEKALNFICKYNTQDIFGFELQLLEGNLSGYMNYLEMNNRIGEATSLLPTFEKKHFSQYQQFILKNKHQWPEKARKALYSLIESECQYTGDYHYDNIVKYLLQLQEIEKLNTFLTYVSVLKSSYSRRINLISRLKNNGLIP